MSSPDMVADDGEKSVDEKLAAGHSEGDLADRGEVANLPPDPDAHLTAEERARIVRISASMFRRGTLFADGSARTVNYCGSWI
jgi:hypothetical protein